MKKFLIILLMMCSLSTFSQKNDLIYLWPGKVPGETKEKQPPAIDVSKSDNIIRFSEVTNPAIEVYLPNPSLKNESAIIVCPGGSLSARASTLYTKRTYHAVDKSDSLSCRPSFTMLIYPAYLDHGPNLTITPEMKLPAASSGVSKYQPHKTNPAASCGELTPKEIRVKQRGTTCVYLSDCR